MVVAKGELLGNLYRLVGETLLGEAVVASTKSESPALWHKHLGHMSERGFRYYLNKIFFLIISQYRLISMMIVCLANKVN